MKFIKGFDPNSIKDKLKITKITTDTSYLTKNQKKVINNLIECAKIIDDIFYLQKYPDSLKLRNEINKKKNPSYSLFYKTMAGPFDKFNGDKPYIEDVKSSDKAGFYLGNITKKDIEEYIIDNPDEKDILISPYTVLQKKSKKINIITYSEFYNDRLLKASELLHRTEEFADNYTLKEYLSSQANAFLTNDFGEADIRWLQLEDNDIVPLLGAYEFYEDKFLGYKAAFSAFVGLKNREEFNKLNIIKEYRVKLQERLPIPEHYRKQKRGSISQIEVVNILYNAGDARGPIPTAAFNLPNSHKIRSEFGSKKVLLHNIIENKFKAVMLPISEKILNENDQSKITFESYFNYILLHEVSHELGISFVKDVDGKTQEVVYFLKELYTIIEEAKSDVMGMFSLIYMLKEGLFHNCTFTNVCVTYLVNLFRLIRLGKENAHGLASLIQFNFLKEEEIFILDKNKEFINIDLHKFEKSIEKLLTILLTLQGEGDYEKSNKFINDYSKKDPDIEKLVSRITELPLDILTWFPEAGEKKPVFNKS